MVPPALLSDCASRAAYGSDDVRRGELHPWGVGTSKGNGPVSIALAGRLSRMSKGSL